MRCVVYHVTLYRAIPPPSGPRGRLEPPRPAGHKGPHPHKAGPVLGQVRVARHGFTPRGLVKGACRVLGDTVVSTLKASTSLSRSAAGEFSNTRRNSSFHSPRTILTLPASARARMNRFDSPLGSATRVPAGRSRLCGPVGQRRLGATCRPCLRDGMDQPLLPSPPCRVVSRCPRQNQCSFEDLRRQILPAR